MGWLTRLGNSIQGGAQRLGNAVHRGADAAVRLVDNVAPVVERVAGKVATGAGVVSKIAGMATPFVAEIPLVGEVVGGIAAGAKAVQGAALGVKAGAKFAEKAIQGIQRAEGTITGQLDRVGTMAKDFSTNPNLSDARRYGNELSSMTRHNMSNIRDARDQAKRVATDARSSVGAMRGRP